MRNLLFIFMLSSMLLSCSDILEDPDLVRTGIQIDEELMGSNIWRVEYFSDDTKNSPDGFQGAFLEFNMDNTFDLINSDKELYTGEWALSQNKDLLVIRSDGKIVSPYNEIENEWIILKAESANIRVQERDPEGEEQIDFGAASDYEIPNVCQNITKLIRKKEWRIQHLVIRNEDVTSQYKNFEFVFDTEARASAGNGINSFTGSWQAGIRCDKFHLGFDHINELKDISNLWHISYFTESTIKLALTKESQKWEMELVTGENLTDNLCNEAESIVTTGSWMVSKFVTGNDNYSNDISKYLFQFKDNGQLVAFNNDQELIGDWSLVNDCKNMSLAITGNDYLDKMNEDWKLVLVSTELIKLIAETENRKKEIQFTKLPEPADFCDSLNLQFEKEQTWNVSLYQVNDDNLTGQLKGVTIEFSQSGTLVITNGDHKTDGTWVLSENCEKIEIKSDEDNTTNKFSLNWHITKVTESKITFVYEGEKERIELQLTI